MRFFAFLFAATALIVAACMTANPAGGTGSCLTDAECPPGMICGFAQTDGCFAGGQCFPAPQSKCDAYAPGCACDKTDINIACTGLPIGYYAKQLDHPNVCVDACTPANVCLTTTACTADRDCASLGSVCDTCALLCACSPPDAAADGPLDGPMDG